VEKFTFFDVTEDQESSMRQSNRRQARKEVSGNELLQPLLTIADVCKLLQLSRPMIYVLIEQGLPVMRFGKAVRFSPTSLQRWLAGREEIA
jgi:excisionase family DNA binding protein